jgi:hypothetical protein
MRIVSSLYFLLIFLFVYTSPLHAIYTTPTGQEMIERSNKMYSGNKYNLPQNQYNQLNKQIYNGYGGGYYNYPYYYNYNPYSSYTPYDNYGYNYGYGGGIPPYPSDQTFPDAARADALYQYIQGR